MFKQGNDVITVPQLWHNGNNIGERLATVIKVEGYIWIKVHQYDQNPVKVFSYEIEHCSKGEDIRLVSDNEIEFLLDEFFPKGNTP